jgi:putative ABC transport system permease protein
MTWRRFFRRSRLDDEVARDLEFYIEAETADNVARGMPAGEARAAARRKLGNPTFLREEVYRMNTAGLLDTIWQDLRYAYRVLRQAPAFTATAILSLALGIGGNTAVFTVVRGVLLKPLPYREPGGLVKVAETDPDSLRPETVDFTTTYDLRARSRSFESLSLFRDAAGAIVGDSGSALLNGMRVNYDYFDTLGARMQLGRAFLPEEDRPDRRFEIILTHGLWRSQFGGDPQVIGRTVRLSGSSFVVVGVLPPGFRPMARGGSGAVLPDFYMPLGYALGGDSACRGCQHLQLIGRLKSGVSVEQARQELSSVMQGIAREHPADYPKGIGVLITPLLDTMVSGVSTAMWVLLAAVGLVLLMACANVANLVLAKATGRAQEMSLRAALGASRGRLIRQLALECLLLAVASGVAGVLLAWLATTALVTYGSRELPRIAEIRIDAPVLWFTCAISLITVALFGIMPALRASRVDLAASLKDVGRTTGGRTPHMFRKVLVIAELALAFVLVMGAGLLGRSFLRLTGVDPGYDPHNVLTMGVYVYGERYRKPEAELNFYQQVKQRLLALPGVESVGMTSTLLLSGFDRRSVHIQDRPLANPAEAPSADTYSVSPDYFRVLRIPLKRGRFFSDADREGAPDVALISESCARTLFADRDAIGKHVEFGGRDNKRWATIVGIVGDVRQHGLDQPSNMEVYLAQAQNVNFGYTLLMRTTGDAARLAKSVRAVFTAVDPTQPIYRLQPLEAYLADTLGTRTFTLVLLSVFGGLALALAAVGIYGAFSYAVSARTREVGIRMALGAGRRDVLTMVLRQGLGLIGAGLGIGMCVSLVLARFLAKLLYETGPSDPVTFVGAAAGLSAIAMLATYLPARRATRIDPMTALR